MNPSKPLVPIGLLIAMAGFAAADQPGREPPGAPGQPGSGFIPAAGYLRTLQQLDLQRRLGVGGPGALAPSLIRPISGTRLVPVICVQFPNRPGLFSTARHREVLFDPAGPARPVPPRPTLTQYYRDISLGRFEPNGEVFGWFTLANNDSFYEEGLNGLGQRMGDLIREGLLKADAGTDFGQFDNDGADGKPNSGDDDGVVDTVVFIHPEVGGEAQSVNPLGQDNIWSHQWQYSKYAAHGRPFRTNDPRKDATGAQRLDDTGSPEFIRVEDYTIQPGLSEDSRPGALRIVEIGVFCHEFGHALGLPDLYDRPGTGLNSSGIGNYCLMAAGSRGSDGQHPATPVHMSAWCKAVLGWADVRAIDADGPIALEAVQQGNRIYNFDVPGTGGREFFLVEYRDPNWVFNPGTQFNWDSGISPGGLAIWHVDENVGRILPSGISNRNWPFAPAGQGQNDAPSLPGTPPPSFLKPHALVALMQFDKSNHLEKNVNGFDSTDLHGTGSVFGDDASCRCGSRSYGDPSRPTGFGLRGINLAAGQALASVSAGPAPAPAATIAAEPAPAEVIAAIGQDAIEAARGLQPIGRKLIEEGPAALSDEDRRRLADAPISQLRLGLSKPALDRALQVAASERTQVVGKQSEARTPTQAAAKALIGRSEGESALVRFAPGAGVEQVSRLAIPTEGRSPLEDASYRVAGDEDVKKLLGAPAELRPDADQPALQGQSGSVHLSQIVEVDGKKVPLSCHGATFRYKDGKLTAISADILDTEPLKITGSSDALGGEEARQVLSKQAGLSPDRILRAQPCVYLIGGQPDQARTAIRMEVDSGGERPPISIFLDQESRKVLAID